MDSLDALEVLREVLRNKRKALPHRTQKQNARRLLYQCQKQSIFKQKQKIAIYLPFDGEIQTQPIINFLTRQGKQIFVPKINRDKLCFVPLKKPYKNNHFGIIEPRSTKYYHPRKINLILLPLVGFDKRGNRLGMGAGFYDKALNFIQKQKHFQQPKLYGIAHSCQQVKALNPQKWDIKPSIIITEKASFPKSTDICPKH